MKLTQNGQGVVEAIAIVGFVLVILLTLIDLQERSIKLSMEGVNTRIGVIDKASRKIPSRQPEMITDQKNITLPLDSLERKKDNLDVRSTVIY